MRSLSFLASAVLLTLVGLVVVRSQAQNGAGPVLFEGARLIIGDSSAPLVNGAFLIENGRFAAVGPRGSIKAPSGTRRVDVSGKTIMPAMVNVHAHLGY